MPGSPVLVMEPARRDESRVERGDRTAPQAYLVSVSVLTAALITGPLMFGAVSPRAYALGCFLIAAAFAACATEALWLRENCVSLSPLLWPALLFGSIAVLQLLSGSTAYRFVTETALLQMLSWLLVIAVVTQACAGDRALRILLFSLIGFGALVACFAMVQQLSGATRIYGFHRVLHPQNLYGPYPNRDHYAGLMEMLAPLPLVCALSAALPREVRILLGSAAVLMTASVVLSGSRGGLVAIAAEILFLAIYLWSKGRGRQYFVLLVVFFAATCAFLYWLDASPALLRWKQLDTAEELASGRLAIARDTIHMWRARPWLGHGLGTFTTVYPQYRSFYTDQIVNETHNDYLQVLVETGVAGAAAMLWFIVTLYRNGMMSRRSRRADLRDLFRLGALTGCTGLLVHSFFDFNLHIPANAWMFFALAAVVCLPAREVDGVSRHE